MCIFEIFARRELAQFLVHGGSHVYQCNHTNLLLHIDKTLALDGRKHSFVLSLWLKYSHTVIKYLLIFNILKLVYTPGLITYTACMY